MGGDSDFYGNPISISLGEGGGGILILTATQFPLSFMLEWWACGIQSFVYYIWKPIFFCLLQALENPQLQKKSKPLLHEVYLDDDDELMLNVLRCHLTY